MICEDGDAANEIPLIDWYIIHSPGNAFGTTFDATNLPTPGATGVHNNKNKIIHTEKGLSGVAVAASNAYGNAMVFKGVIRLPRGKQRVAAGDQWKLCARANFACKVCFQFIYKHYS